MSSSDREPHPRGQVRRKTHPKFEADGTPSPTQRTKLSVVVIGVLVCWTYLFNITVKGMSPSKAFFHILDTISDDFLVGSLVTVAVGVLIVILFTTTKLYTQIISNVYSFRILEDIFVRTLLKWRFKECFASLLAFEHQPKPVTIYPDRSAFMLIALALIYAMSWVYVVLFSEALFFISWSAGVDLPITPNNLLLLPTLSLAMPFSARVMAYARYPYAQDYADFMPAALFVLLIVMSLGFLFQSEGQKFFLEQVFANPVYRYEFLRNGLSLAFVPVFSEALFWLFSVARINDAQAFGDSDSD